LQHLSFQSGASGYSGGGDRRCDAMGKQREDESQRRTGRRRSGLLRDLPSFRHYIFGLDAKEKSQRSQHSQGLLEFRLSQANRKNRVNILKLELIFHLSQTTSMPALLEVGISCEFEHGNKN
jgi:hypothetical protein